MRQFATGLSARFNMGWTPAQVDVLISEALPPALSDPVPVVAGSEQNSNFDQLRLVLRHDCQ